MVHASGRHRGALTAQEVAETFNRMSLQLESMEQARTQNQELRRSLSLGRTLGLQIVGKRFEWQPVLARQVHRRVRRDLYGFLKAEMNQVKLELSVAKSGKQGKSKVEVSNPYQMEKLRWFCRED